MQTDKKAHPAEKIKLHPRNKHRERYDFKQLTKSCPDLKKFVKPNKYGDESIDFFNPEAVITLNTALLKHYYGVKFWEIPPQYLSPPIPGRADYIHHVADFLAKNNNGKIPTGSNINCLDIGVGASCIYPIIGQAEYGWSFTGSDIDPKALKSANSIIKANSFLKNHCQLRMQKNPKTIFKGIIKENERFDLSICNPPFYASAEDAQKENIRKLRNLKQQKIVEPSLNFGGQNNELWCEGGEVQFVQFMVRQSTQVADNVLWFSSIISRESNLERIYKVLKSEQANHVETISMGQGNKKSRIVVWTFQKRKLQEAWMNTRWK
jgi:23S rRNA (adenine1618-N6)-methyltransferase